MTPNQQLADAMARPRRSKFGNRATVVDGIRFASQAEARRWSELQMLERAGQIHGLRRQPRYPLHALGGDLVGHYVGDFEFSEPGRGVVTEDVKGMRTQTYDWKKRHFEAEYRRPIVEIKSR
jgi:hypothetical protein